eukprot:766293-Hanusia_phi.AAC.6
MNEPSPELRGWTQLGNHTASGGRFQPKRIIPSLTLVALRKTPASLAIGGNVLVHPNDRHDVLDCHLHSLGLPLCPPYGLSFEQASFVTGSAASPMVEADLSAVDFEITPPPTPTFQPCTDLHP